MKEEILLKKENNKELNYDELAFYFNGYLNNDINDEAMTKLLKAICKYGLNEKEINDLTDIFIKSGDIIDLSELGNCVDKHSTGGVGDKTTLIVAPIVAACNVKIAKMSGRALGFTGGTIDKLESIRGYNVSLSEDDFFKQVKAINIALISQTANLCPMDKKVYALRDVTNTVESLGLIAVSIMSKKIASGAKIIVIDLKVGQGALIKNIKDARKLANIMINIGKKYNRIVRCVLTSMDNPLGNNIGNSLEVLEAIDVLQNEKHDNLAKLCIILASNIISLAKNITIEVAEKEVQKVLETNRAYLKFLELISYQKGDISSINYQKGITIKSNKKGYLTKINARTLGEISMSLGAGRININDQIDYNAGIIINKSINDYVNINDTICTIYGNKEIDVDKLLSAFKLSFFKTKEKDIVIEII